MHHLSYHSFCLSLPALSLYPSDSTKTFFSRRAQQLGLAVTSQNKLFPFVLSSLIRIRILKMLLKCTGYMYTFSNGHNVIWQAKWYVQLNTDLYLISKQNHDDKSPWRYYCFWRYKLNVSAVSGYSGFSSQRINLSPFTKDFRGEEQI